MNWFYDLWNRLVTNYQSTLTGVITIILTWLADHGISLSETNSKFLIAKFVAIGLGLLKIFGKDAPAPSDNGGSSFRGGSGTFGGPGTKSAFGLLLICSLALGASGCWFKNKTSTHQLAIATANATTALGGEVESVEVFKRSGRISADAARSVHEINKKVNESVGVIRERAQKGYEKKDLLAIASATSDDLLKLETAGVVSLKNPTDAQLFRDTVSVAKFTIDTIRELIEVGKAPPPPAAAKTLTEEITAIVGIARTVAFDMWRQGRMSQDEAFADGEARTAQLRERLIALTL